VGLLTTFKEDIKMDTTLLNIDTDCKHYEYEKMKLVRVAIALKDKFVEITNRKDLYIQFPTWLWYRNGWADVSCRELVINLIDVYKFDIWWEDKYIIIAIQRDGDGIHEKAKFEDNMEFELFVNNITINLVDSLDESYPKCLPSPKLFPDGCVPPIVYEAKPCGSDKE